MSKRRKILSLLLAGSIVMGTGMLYVEAGQRQGGKAPVAGVLSVFAELLSENQKIAGIATDKEKVIDASSNMAGGRTAQNIASENDMSGNGTALENDMSGNGAVPENGDIALASIEENNVPAVASEYTDIAIAQVNNYVNVRALPNTESEVLGKLYNNSAATILETTEDGWYRIQSGKVNGYVKAEYVVAGDEELAKAVSTRYATVTTTTLFVRSQPTTESAVLTMLPEGDDLEVLDESEEGWVKVATVEGEGYVSKEYVSLSTVYVEAESKEEEQARLAKEEAERKAAAEAAERARAEAARAEERRAEKERVKNAGKANTGKVNTGKGSETSSKEPAGKDTANQNTAQNHGNAQSNSGNVSNGQAVVDYARQFLGNPYVYGGTSLTNGADCSGFVQSVYKAFGVSLPRNSAAQRSAGYAVSVEQIQPGDLVCYSGHIGIYAGNNTLIHASNERTGITLTSPITYRKILAVRRIF